MRIIGLILLTATMALAQATSVQEMLNHAVRTSTAEVKLPEGRVKVKGKLLLSKADGLVINGRNTTLVFSNHRGTSWSFNSCRNITLRGFTIDYAPLPFVQGRITGRSEDGKQYDFTVCEGYPGLNAQVQDEYRQAYIFEPDQARWKPWVPDIYARRVEIIDERRGRMVMGYVPECYQLIQPGDRIVFTIRSGAAIRMNYC